MTRHLARSKVVPWLTVTNPFVLCVFARLSRVLRSWRLCTLTFVCRSLPLLRVETNCSLVISNSLSLNERLFEYQTGKLWLIRYSKSQQANMLRGAWRDRDTNDISAHCSLISYFLDFKFSNFICLSELHPLIWFFLKIPSEKRKVSEKPSKTP